MRSPLRHPARIVPAAFALASLAGTLLLSLPSATSTGQRAQVLDAAFTSVSAVCVTGLVTVDTATYWSPFGQVVILSLVQVGGFGIMTLATLLVVLVGARLNLSSSLVAQAETHALNVGDVRDVVRRIAVTMLAFEAVLAALLTLRFRVGYDHDWPQALWLGVFHSVTAFNNAGFALSSDNLMGFAADAWILLPICVGVIVGGIGFPVLFELRRRWRHPRLWSVHVRLTVYGSALLLAMGAVAFLALEWSNPGTLGPMSPGNKILGGLAGSVMPRTAGFNTVDYAAVTPETVMVTSLLMFIGGGSAGTAGGIKVATFFLLAFVIWTEVRGERDTTHRAPPDQHLDDASGADRRAAGCRGRRSRNRGPAAGHRLGHRRRRVRGHLRVRDRGPLDRHHGGTAGVREADPDGAHVRGPRGHDHGSLRAGSADPSPPLPPARGASHCRLTATDSRVRSSWPASAGSEPRSP